jgi:hypothetical protein
MRVDLRQNYIIVPSAVVLTVRVVAGAICKLSTDKIRELIQVAIEELDYRSGDPDSEPDFDAEDHLIV